MQVSVGRGWSRERLLLLAAMLGLVAWWGRRAMEDIYVFATGQTDNGYILLAPFVAVYLAWIRRSRLQFLAYRPSLLGAALVAAGVLGSNWGEENGVQIAWHGGVLIARFGCVYSLTGGGIVR